MQSFKTHREKIAGDPEGSHDLAKLVMEVAWVSDERSAALVLPFQFQLLQAHFSLSGILAAHYPANQGQALLAHLTDIGDESESDAGQGFAGQVAIEFARPCRYLIAMLRRA